MDEQEVEGREEILVEESDAVEEIAVEEETAQESPRDPDKEAEARKYGWRPKEEFDRDPDGWVDAERFLELPSTHKKQLRDELRETKSEMATRLQRLEAANKAAMDRALEAQKAQYESELATLRRMRREAAEVGDTDRYDRIEAREQELLKAPPQAPQEAPQVDPALAEYMAQNEWVKNPILKDAGARIIAARPDILAMPHIEQVKFAEAEVRKLYPAYFPQAEQKSAPRQKVDGGGLAGGKVSLANKLPPEAKAAAKEFVEAGYFKSIDDYAKTYFEQEG